MDDESSIRDLGREIMGMLGYEAVTASDGAEAVEKFRAAKDASKPFDVVILDLTVPGGMSGLEALRQLRAMDSEVRAIVSSGYSNDPIMSDYGNYGFSGVVAKPYTPKELSRALAAVLGGTD